MTASQPDLAPYGDNRAHVVRVGVNPDPQRLPVVVLNRGRMLRTIKPIIHLSGDQVDELTVEVDADQLRRVVPL